MTFAEALTLASKLSHESVRVDIKINETYYGVYGIKFHGSFSGISIERLTTNTDWEVVHVERSWEEAQKLLSVGCKVKRRDWEGYMHYVDGRLVDEAGNPVTMLKEYTTATWRAVA